MINITIIGCGWLGKITGRYLIQQGCRVVGTCTTPQGTAALTNLQILPVALNITVPPNNLVPPTALFTTDMVIISLKPSRKTSDNGLYVAQNEWIINQLEQSNVPRVILLSSTSVYGNHNRIADENTTPEPDKPGGESMVDVERLYLNNSNFNTTVLRLGGLTGYNRNPLNTLQQGRATENMGVPLNLVHADDVARFIGLVAKNNHLTGIYNLVASHHPLRYVYYAPAYKQLGKAMPIISVSEANYKIVDNRKALAVNGFTFLMDNPLTIWDWAAQGFNQLNLMSIE